MKDFELQFCIRLILRIYWILIVSDIIKKQHCTWKPIESRAGTQNWCYSNCQRINGVVSNHCKEICHEACGNFILMNQS